MPKGQPYILPTNPHNGGKIKVPIFFTTYMAEYTLSFLGSFGFSKINPIAVNRLGLKKPDPRLVRDNPTKHKSCDGKNRQDNPDIVKKPPKRAEFLTPNPWSAMYPPIRDIA